MCSLTHPTNRSFIQSTISLSHSLNRSTDLSTALIGLPSPLTFIDASHLASPLLFASLSPPPPSPLHSLSLSLPLSAPTPIVSHPSTPVAPWRMPKHSLRPPHGSQPQQPREGAKLL